MNQPYKTVLNQPYKTLTLCNRSYNFVAAPLWIAKSQAP